MFGIGLTKILLLAAIVAAVWYGFRWWNAQQVARQAQPPAAKTQGRRTAPVEDMRACPTCGVFVAISAGPCQREDCPLR